MIQSFGELVQPRVSSCQFVREPPRWLRFIAVRAAKDAQKMHKPPSAIPIPRVHINPHHAVGSCFVGFATRACSLRQQPHTPCSPRSMIGSPIPLPDVRADANLHGVTRKNHDWVFGTISATGSSVPPNLPTCVTSGSPTRKKAGGRTRSSRRVCRQHRRRRPITPSRYLPGR
jgi:hypothetical protein